MNNKIKLQGLLRDMVNEEIVNGVKATEKAQKESKKFNDEYNKDVSKKMKDYEEPVMPKEDKDIADMNRPGNPEDNAKVKNTDVKNGMELLNVEGEPNKTWEDRQDMALKGDSKMGNATKTGKWNPETGEGNGNTEEVWGASGGRVIGDDIAKNVKDIRAMRKKEKEGKEVDMTKIYENKKIIKEYAEVDLELKSLIKKIYSQLKKLGWLVIYQKVTPDNFKDWDGTGRKDGQNSFTRGDDNPKQLGVVTLVHMVQTEKNYSMQLPTLGVYFKDFNDESESTIKGIMNDIKTQINSIGEFKSKAEITTGGKSYELQFYSSVDDKAANRFGKPEINTKSRPTTNATQINENKTKKKDTMKRLRFKKPFDGLGNALNLIPETYKVNEKEFEMTDGVESYTMRWEGNLNEGAAVVLKAADQNMINEDMEHMKHLMGFNSNENLGRLKGHERINENESFKDVWDLTTNLMNENLPTAGGSFGFVAEEDVNEEEEVVAEDDKVSAKVKYANAEGPMVMAENDDEDEDDINVDDTEDAVPDMNSSKKKSLAETSNTDIIRTAKAQGRDTNTSGLENVREKEVVGVLQKIIDKMKGDGNQFNPRVKIYVEKLYAAINDTEGN